MQKVRENRCINEILTTDGKLSLDPLVGKKKKKLSKNILYEYITRTPFTPRTQRDSKLNYLSENDRKELEKEIFPSQVKTTIHSLSIGKSLGPDGCPTEF